LNVLFATATDLSRGGGDVEHILGIAQGFSQAGNDVSVVCRAAPLEPPDRVRFVVSQGRSTTMSVVKAGRTAVTRAREVRPDLVYVRPFPGDGLFLRALPKSVPVVAELNTIVGAETMVARSRTAAVVATASLGLVLRRATAWLGVTDEVLEAGRRIARTTRPSFLVKNGYSPERAPPPGTRSHEPRLLMMGFERAWHGADRAVDLLPLVPGARLRLIGSTGSSVARALRSRAGQLGVADRLTIEPWCDGDELRSELAGATLGIGPLAMDRKNMRQAQPIKTRLYLGAGLPVLANYDDPIIGDRPFHPSVPSSDLGDLASIVEDLLRHAGDVGPAARAFALRELTWRQAAEETLVTLDAIVRRVR